ncbi:MAG: hypothetical protein P1Q69_18305, partial [Candidatus Thorarchaeota archaeon]|nr:hypothetical protein [Candidatus Thorarchaeota archaeon]
MKRALQVMLAVLVVGMFMVTPVAAATSQGLEWGFVIADRFDYTLTNTEDDFSEDIYLNVTGMPALAIPDPIGAWSAIPEPSIGFWWANGTSMGLYVLLFIGIIAVGSKIAVPIGNFTHLQSLVQPVITGETIIDTSNTWGIEWSQDSTATEKFVITITYAKVDGFLAEYSMETKSTLNSSVLESLSVERDSIPSPGLPTGDILQLIQDNILYIAIG